MMTAAPPDPDINAYLREQGLRSFPSQQRFWRWARKEIGRKNVERLLASMQQRASGEMGDSRAFYDYLSEPKLACVAASFEYSLLVETARWVVSRLPCSGTIVELGAHNGLLTCFYALARPAATVIGIDSSEAAIDRAQERASSQGLANVAFQIIDLTEAEEAILPRADCIISGRVLGELMTMVRRQRENWRDYSFRPSVDRIDPDLHAGLQCCQQMLPHGGSLLLTERLSDYDRLERLWAALHDEGFTPHLQSVTSVVWKDIAGDHHTWFFAASNTPPERPAALPVVAIPLASHNQEALEQPTRLLLDGILAWQTWRALGSRQIDEEQTLSWPGGEEIHVEIGTAGGTTGYAYVASNTDLHLLTLFLPQERDAVWRDLREYIVQLRRSGAS